MKAEIALVRLVKIAWQSAVWFDQESKMKVDERMWRCQTVRG